MLKFKLSIKARLIVSSFLFMALFAAIIVFSNVLLKKTQKNYQAQNMLEEVNILTLDMQNIYKDFVNLESTNPDFFKTGNSLIADKLTANYTKINSDLSYLKHETDAKELDILKDLIVVADSVEKYYTLFTELKDLMRKRGFKDGGLVGEWRNIIHRVESILDKQNDLQSQVYMLTLRRHEKDYLLRNDTKYFEKLQTALTEYYNYLDSRPYNPSTKEIKTLLQQYDSLFSNIIEIDAALGITNNGGVMPKLDQCNNYIHNKLKLLGKQVAAKNKDNLKTTLLRLFIIIGGVLLLIMLLYALIIREIIASNQVLEKHSQKLSLGELPAEISIKYHNEISRVIQSINKLTQNLRKSREFAVELGKGNFDSGFVPVSDKDLLGNALLNMRTELVKAAREDEQRKQQDFQVNWASKGTGMFAEIIRKSDQDLETLSYQVLANLISYTKSNQGCLFLVNDNDKEQVLLEMAACYAYDRKKLLEKTYQAGEGLIGRCYLERDKIFLTEIPENYISITSGTGQASPKCLLLVPLMYNGTIYGILEIASFNIYQPYQVEFMMHLGESIAASIATTKSNAKTKELLEISKQQAEEMHAQEEEMRQNMEELRATQEQSLRREEEMKQEIDKLRKKLNRS